MPANPNNLEEHSLARRSLVIAAGNELDGHHFAGLDLRLDLKTAPSFADVAGLRRFREMPSAAIKAGNLDGKNQGHTLAPAAVLHN
ncbi:MAG: hypothetical protein WAR21_12775, partial [Candidatus Acidiferrales bacterium]